MNLNAPVNGARPNPAVANGVMTSQYFMQVTNVSNPRQVDVSMRFSF